VHAYFWATKKKERKKENKRFKQIMGSSMWKENKVIQTTNG